MSTSTLTSLLLLEKFGHDILDFQVHPSLAPTSAYCAMFAHLVVAMWNHSGNDCERIHIDEYFLA
jgi:hypothetical protein